ncbi:hypothetical protein F8M41_016801 [Gigaspora margarita]|uniref:F-box domain-containing protein n=1 Tax=Gigaspora margarita TaxID=4874 RepID=A0A8H4AP36_GIGMA|nr:hypothetical protein F8M41_016801 [Gigaspora margarita]
MASKIFMGDMPELMENILNYLNNEYHSLYSCALVSRHWCKMAIPVIWRDPFSLERNPIIIPIYLSYLIEAEKLILKEHGLIVDYPNTLFHYARFLEVLNLAFLNGKVIQWIKLQLFDQQTNISSLKNHIINLLLKIFIDGGARLTKFKLSFFNNIGEIKSEIFNLLDLNKRFFSRLEEVYVNVVRVDKPCFDKAIELLRILAKNATKLNSFNISSLKVPPILDSDYHSKLCHEFIRIIKSQEKLKRFGLFGRPIFYIRLNEVILALESQKKTLKEIIIYNCRYNIEFEELINGGKLEKLDVIRIINCKGGDKMLKSLNINHYKVSTLEITTTYYANRLDYSVRTLNVIQILENSGTLLQRFKFNLGGHEISSQTLLLETLLAFCPNIVYLNLSTVNLSDQLLNLISSLQKLQFLTLYWIEDKSDIMKERVIQLAKILPSTLQYLDLSKNLHIDILLNQCDAPLRQLIFYVDYFYKKKMEALINYYTKKRTLHEVNIVIYTKETRFYRFEDWNVSATCWDKIKQALKGHVKLLPYQSIVVNC